MQCGFDTGKELQAGLYCDRGTARFDNLRIYSLINDRKDEKTSPAHQAGLVFAVV